MPAAGADVAAGAAADAPPGGRRTSGRCRAAAGRGRARLADAGKRGADRHRLPDCTRISSITPSYGLGISESTLSVDTSNSGSSNATASPTCLSQLLTVPSVTVSPSLGMVMSCTSPVGAESPGAAVAGIASEPPVAGAAGSDSEGPPAAGLGPPSEEPGVDPGSPMRTSGAPTGTVSPDCTRISRITPS